MHGLKVVYQNGAPLDQSTACNMLMAYLNKISMAAPNMHSPQPCQLPSPSTGTSMLGKRQRSQAVPSKASDRQQPHADRDALHRMTTDMPPESACAVAGGGLAASLEMHKGALQLQELSKSQHGKMTRQAHAYGGSGRGGFGGKQRCISCSRQFNLDVPSAQHCCYCYEISEEQKQLSSVNLHALCNLRRSGRICECWLSNPAGAQRKAVESERRACHRAMQKQKEQGASQLSQA